MKTNINWNKIKEKASGKPPVDTRFWTTTPRADGNFNAVIRFLPAPDTDIPWIEEVKHGFQPEGGNGKWFIEHCLRGTGENCPICTAGWNKKQEADRTGSETLSKQAKSMMKQEKYICNILVIKDRQNPENEGKVFLWKFGREVYKKIMSTIQPTNGDEPILIFEPKQGTNFKVDLYTTKPGPNVKSYLKYDNCRFMDSIVPLDDDTIKYVDDNIYPLQPFLDKMASERKSAQELIDKLDSMTGFPTKATQYQKTQQRPTQKPAPEPVQDEEESTPPETFMDRSKGFDAPSKPEQTEEEDDDNDDFLTTIRNKTKKG